MKLDVTFVGHRARLLKGEVEAPGCSAGLLSNLFDEFGYVVDLLYRYHMKIGIVLPGYGQRQSQGLKRRFRAVVGVQDSTEHPTFSRSSRDVSRSRWRGK
jgi:hypothetical protein